MNVETSNVVDVLFGVEATYGTVAAAMLNSFGIKSKLTYNAKRNTGKGTDLGVRTFVNAYELKHEWLWDIDSVVCNELIWPHFLCSGDGTGPTPYIFDAEGDVKPLSILINDRQENKKRHLLGCTVNETTISMAVGEETKYKFGGTAKEMGASGASVARASLGTINGLDAPFTFIHGSLKFATVENYFGLVQKLELKIGNDLGTYWGLGSALAHTTRHKAAIGGMTVGLKKASDATKQGVEVIRTGVADAEDIACVITITDGTRTITMTLSLVYIDDFSTGLEYAEDIDENLVFIFSSISIVLAGF